MPVRIDTNDEDFSDLELLREILANVRVVQLGEQTHGDGTTFEAKVRLIKFLHRDMGYSVLAFESGLYDCAAAWKATVNGDDPQRVARRSVFGLWSQSRQVSPLWSYMASTARSQHPLELAGFDSQFTGEMSRKRLIQTAASSSDMR